MRRARTAWALWLRLVRSIWPTVAPLIRESPLRLLWNPIQTCGKGDPMLMGSCLYDLYRQCLITHDAAMSRARHPVRINRSQGETRPA
ncbi:MAG TPA: hypothetical protein VNO52_04030 [Methylomirabilota bacterium]|nr:hypothetical protein [Methylomirabilota bacterium]